MHFLAPLSLVVTVFMGFAVLPMGRNMVLVDMDAGLLFYFAMGASTELSVFMAGWSSRNKYSLLGAMRAMAQMISYEVPLLLSSVAVVMADRLAFAGTRSSRRKTITPGVCRTGSSLRRGDWRGSCCSRSPRRPRRTARHLICRKANRNWWPATYTEYSGFKFALFFLGEYVGMFSISGLGTTLFLGGWSAPSHSFSWCPRGYGSSGSSAFDLCVHLAARNAAAASPGSVDELRMEIRAADVPF